jgi:hypothetical protein
LGGEVLGRDEVDEVFLALRFLLYDVVHRRVCFGEV